MIDTLIPMRQFVLQDFERELGQDFDAYVAMQLRHIKSYANFLSIPLKLGYFVPCDENDVPIENPIKLLDYGYYDSQDPHGDGWNKPAYQKDVEAYKAAQSRVLFEGFEYDGMHLQTGDKIVWFGELKGIIEDLVHLNLPLTPTAKKMIYGG